MKRGVYILVFLLSIQLATAVCVDSDGKDFLTFGSVDANGLTKHDECFSPTQLKEYFCTEDQLDSVVTSCVQGCVGGVCVPTTCSDSECNPGLSAYCSGGNWEESNYCSECSEVDSSCSSITCQEGTCDYNSHKVCKNDQWVSEYYCDVTQCGNNEYSQDFCFCQAESSTETSCTDFVDNDCDGSFDCNDADCSEAPGCECVAGQTQSCGNNLGVCSEGAQTCVDGTWSECSGVEPTFERCDGLDNDCDGVVDNDCRCEPGEIRDCGQNVGVCKAGVQTCQADGSWSLCFGASYGAANLEQCNGLDDDCDGKIDETCDCVEGSSQTCGTSIGSCREGTQLCVNGTYTECLGDVAPELEVCSDNLDNDCDGLLDFEDDNCAAGMAPETECERDIDCDRGFTCTEGICVEEVGVQVDVAQEPTVTTEPDTSSQLTSTSFETERKGPGLGGLVIPVIIFILLVLGVMFFLKSRKKKKKPKTEEKVSTKTYYKKPNAPVTTKISTKKSKVEEKLEKSFKKSKELFGK